MQKDLHRQESHEAENQHPRSRLLTGGSDAIHNWILRLLKDKLTNILVYVPYVSTVSIDFYH